MSASFQSSVLRIVLLVAILGFRARALAGITWQQTAQSMIAESGTGSVAFHFRNDGTEAVQIIAVKASCVCIDAVASQKNVEPGMSAEILTTYRGIPRKTTEKKTIAVVSISGTTRQTDVLKLHVDVQPGIVFDPPLLIWDKGEAPQPKTAYVKPTRTDQPALKIKEITGGEPNFKVEINSSAAGSGNNASFTVTPLDTTKPVRSLVRVFFENSNPLERSAILYAIVQP